MTGMDDLVTWLRAQLDDDERVAQACAGAPWSADVQSMVHVDAAAIAGNRAWRELGYVASVEREANRQHIARWDPARVLAEVDAKRRILDLADHVNGLDDSVDLDRRVGIRDTVAEPYAGDRLVRVLALPYVDRPGYRDEWRPDDHA